MSEKNDDLNKQIASFVLVSLALSAPVAAENFNSDENIIADNSNQSVQSFNNARIISMYAVVDYPKEKAPTKEKVDSGKKKLEQPTSVLKYGLPPMVVAPSESMTETQTIQALKYAPPQWFIKQSKDSK